MTEKNFKILIIDDDPIVRTILKKTLQNQGYEISVASNGEEGITTAQNVRPALIICDWMMQELDGLDVCRKIKADPELATTFFILLTAKGAAPGEEEDRVRGLDAGADEFISKPIEMNELKARVRAGLRLHQLHQDLHTQKQVLEVLNQDLQTQKQILETELAEAADYVRSLLPSPLIGSVNTDALFIPSIQLGGDCFDYYWLDDEHLVIYLLDVSGHGVGSALLSVSVLNLLRSQSLPKTNFYQPREVLQALNHHFQMSKHSEKYFTIWYGVYNRRKRQLVYANAGHPPGVLLSVNSQEINIKYLNSLNAPIGLLPDADFVQDVYDIDISAILYIFSDGIYEFQLPNGHMWSLDGFIDLLTRYGKSHNLEEVLSHLINLSSKASFEDDLSLLKVNFG
ncbi:SpoIIE family protein phosphatase [Aetokthonos hydrillicola Thurmond2011]|jgi:sigma-B regulation protein RsbU (phosphoserine phosphatase)|uniref:SpoIIE family protein phosphatase n=2 Tax=Aetokthonos TaxID=1550243 RepID=A0AAP5I5E5_9CYAN|nr:SpoIIE family protein phosphatase [Aetokthonos hydrillicola]MBO3459850.1 SpoIIE family protein phosphatase [Aetokthonos hydrillicola CCALA 1050]MBW4588462.1 SpoIIE family protein phosphatase [Aetokthonos hydrillicola CCALA 1050]MDR9895049.1 SpoIIE family protein phosphatase [Aetokthonos hydrillicola Thurmond2011]